jgi:hypothetical protein
VILAEGTPAESYVEYDNRHGFHNAHEFAALYPDDTRPSFGYCLPLVEPGMPELAMIRAGYSTGPRRSATRPLPILTCTWSTMRLSWRRDRCDTSKNLCFSSGNGGRHQPHTLLIR